MRDVVEEIRTLVAEDLPTALEGWVTGPAGFTADLVEGFPGIDGLLLIVALIAVFVILVIVYRSPLLPVLVLLDLACSRSAWRCSPCGGSPTPRSSCSTARCRASCSSS